MRNLNKLLAMTAVLLAAPGVKALEIKFQDADGNEESIVDNGRGDRNLAPGTIDFDLCTETGGKEDVDRPCIIAAQGRLQEVTVGPARRLRLSQTPGPPARGVYGNPSNKRGVFEVIFDSSSFSTIPMGSAWRLSYVGSGFDGPLESFPKPQCIGDGTVTTPVHAVLGQLDAGATTLDMVRGATFLDAEQGAVFKRTKSGITPAPATSMRAVWLLDLDACDGIRFPAGIELELIPRREETEDPPNSGDPVALYWSFAITVAFWGLVQLVAAQERQGRMDLGSPRAHDADGRIKRCADT